MALPGLPRSQAAAPPARPLRALLAALAALAIGALSSSSAHAQGEAIRVASNLAGPIYVTAPPGDPRLFIVLRAGVIQILQDGELLPAPFLDIADRVATSGEGGLLGMAFAPDYAGSGVFYLYYTGDGGPDFPFESRVSRFAAVGEPEVSNTADADSEEILFALPQSATNHNGGTIQIRDGWLYLALGDGGASSNTAQDDTTLLGKMLRFDTAQIPVPWQPEIWAKGLRNPFRWSFDRATGDLYIGDVGQGTREEITVVPAESPGGSNFGWDVLEGTVCSGPSAGEPACSDPSLVPPTFEYGSGAPLAPNAPRAVTGGAVYRGSRSPSLRGVYFFADFFTSRLWTFRWDPLTGEAEDFADRTDEFPRDVGDFDQIVAIAEDGFGELYVVSLGGSVYQLVPEPGSAPLAAASVFALLARARRRRPCHDATEHPKPERACMRRTLRRPYRSLISGGCPAPARSRRLFRGRLRCSEIRQAESRRRT